MMIQRKDVQEVLSLIDLTSLRGDETATDIQELCAQAASAYGHVAAVCVYPEYLPQAREALSSAKDIRLATVSNFPQGSDSVTRAVAETKKAIELGADEVDVVFPYQSLLKGEESTGFKLVRQCKLACGDKLLKVILETGALESKEMIQKASEISIDAGADFLKTSTGKIEINATLAAAQAMLEVIKRKNKSVGLKVSGGIKKVEDSMNYIALAKQIMADDWVNPNNFRIGASSLLNDIKNHLN